MKERRPRGTRKERKKGHSDGSTPGNSKQAQTSEFLLPPDTTHTLPVFSSASPHLTLFDPYLILYLRDSAANISAVLIMFSSLSCRKCPSHPDLYLYCNSKLTSFLLSPKHIWLGSEIKNILFPMRHYVMSKFIVSFVFYVSIYRLFILAIYPSLQNGVLGLHFYPSRTWPSSQPPRQISAPLNLFLV